MKLRNEFIQDNLNREKLAKDYTTFLNKLQGNHVIALDAPWGSGKSKFIDFMCSEFDENKDIYVKYNAWENDYTDEPFLSMMSDIFETIIEKEYIGKDGAKNIMTTTLNASKHIGKSIVKGVVKTFLGSESVKELSDGVEEILTGTISDTSNTLIDNVFKTINDTKKTRKEFTKELKLTVSKILKEKEKNKFIIIIDELDRCRPTFAIELLESIKHLFDIEEIVFFIAVDRTQLAESIKSVYGQGFDSNTYLHRFFDMELHLPKINLEKHFEKILNQKFNDEYAYTDYECNTYMTDAINTFDLTIRDFERISSETILLKTISRLGFIEIQICILLLILKYKKSEIYNIIFENDSITYGPLIKKISEVNDSEKFNIFINKHKEILMFTRNQHTDWELKNETKKLLGIIKNTL